MSPSRLLLALLVIVVWGCNFIFIEFSLKEISPLLLCALRFFLASVPAVFFVKPPDAPWKIIAAYGLIMFGLQFALLFMGMQAGMTPGLSSLLMQTQVFFSVLFAVIFLKETPNRWQIFGAVISFLGIGLVAMHLDKSISLLGFALIIGAAATWGVGNLITKRISHVNMMALVIWGSFIACLPLLLCSLIFEGTQSLIYTAHHLSWRSIFSVLYIVYASTWIGYGVWNWLLIRYPVATIAPFTLLIPVVGMLSSILVFGEPLQLWKLIAGLLVITGLCINILGSRYRLRLHSKMAEISQVATAET